MKRKGLLAAGLACLTLAGCGDDGDSEDTSAQAEEARAAVQGQIDAFAKHDFETVCELQDANGVKGSMAWFPNTDSCPEGFAKALKLQEKLQGVGKNPVQDFFDELQEYKVGEATPIDDPNLAPNDWTVELIGPKDATSYLVEEDGEIKVREIFNTLSGADAPAEGELAQPGG